MKITSYLMKCLLCKFHFERIKYFLVNFESDYRQIIVNWKCTVFVQREFTNVIAVLYYISSLLVV